MPIACKFILSLIICLWMSPAKAQRAWDIEEQDFVMMRLKGEEIGKMDFSQYTYRIRLVDYFTSIDTLGEEARKYEVNAVWGTDTLLCYFNKPCIFSTLMRNQKRVNGVQVESKVAPYATFDAAITDMGEEEITELVDSLYRRRSKHDLLVYAPQTCLSYAWECMFRTHGVDPEPICFNRSMYPVLAQGEAMLNIFCLPGETYEARQKVIGKVALPEKSVLIFRNKKGDLLHAAFYMNGRVYSKNGQMHYSIYDHISLLLDLYGRWGKYKSDAAYPEVMCAYTMTVYTLNKTIFNIN